MREPVRFYLDEHVNPAVARALRALGIDVATVVEYGMRGAPDQDHLARSTMEHRVLVSMDRDFARLGATVEGHGGVVLLTRSRDIGTIVRRLAYLHTMLTAEEMANRVEFL